MTQEEFINVIERKNYPYSIEGDTIVFPSRINNITFDITSIPSNVEFRNGGDVVMNVLESVPANVKFNNGGSIFMHNVKSVDPSSPFLNKSRVFLYEISTMIFPPKIKGIRNKRILNLMVKRGLFL
jgi:hypothetical protein